MKGILHLENNILEIKGATRVVSSTQTQAVIETEESGIVITGSEIEVKSLNLEEGEVCLSGNISNIKFSSVGKKQPFFKRIFK